MSDTPIVIVEKVQLRRGLEVELPGKPAQLTPLRLTPGLDEGELGMTVDSGRLFLGHSPRQGDVNYERAVFPYQNLEVLTENSPRVRGLFNEFVRDQENTDYFLPTKLAKNGSLSIIPHAELAVGDLIPSKFEADSATIIVEYAAFVDRPGNTRDGWPVVQGEVRFLARAGSTVYPSNQGSPEESKVEDSVLIGSGLIFGLQRVSNHYRLTYRNQTQEDLLLYMRRVVVTGLTATSFVG